jgi:hypothetical protein
VVAVGKGGIAAAGACGGGADSALGFWGVLETRLWALGRPGMLDSMSGIFLFLHFLSFF